MPRRNPLERVQRHARLLLDVCESEFIENHDFEEPRLYLEAFAKDITCWTYQDRHIALLTTAQRNDSEMFLSLLSGCSNDAAIFRQHFPEKPLSGVTILHMIAKFWGHGVHYREYPQCWWSSLLEQGVRSGADLHAQDKFGNTPFMRVLDGSYISGEHMDWNVIQSWVSKLAKAGVDLELYGEREHRLIAQMRKSGFPPLFTSCGVFTIKYGPMPSDWGLWYRHVGDLFAGVFWVMLEHPERAIPGCWLATEVFDEEDREVQMMSLRLRRSGVKRRVLRRLERECRLAPRTCEEGFPYTYRVAELRAAVDLCAGCYRIFGRRVAWSRPHNRIAALADVLGVPLRTFRACPEKC